MFLYSSTNKQEKGMKYSLNISFKIKYVWIGLLFITIIGLIIFYHLNLNDIKFGLLEVLAYFTGSVTILTLIYHSLNLEYNINTQKEKNRLYLAKYTYDLISEWTKPTMMKSIAVTRELLKDKELSVYLKNPTEIEKFVDYLQKNPKKRAHLVLILNYFENIATMIDTNHIDKEIIKKSFKSFL